MKLTPTASRRAAMAALALVGAVAGSGHARAVPRAEGKRPLRRYTIRAEVVRLPERPGGDVVLRHEAVDDFTDMDGAVVGMDSMTMPFPVARGAWPEGVKVGDKLEALLVVDWGKGFQVLERVSKLPTGTQLHFRKAHRPSSSMAHMDHAVQEAQP
jgi:Cu/Ag efflux protein CusF